MPKKRQNELISLNYDWLLVPLSSGVLQANGRSNPTGLRRSLHTRDREEARRRLKELDLLLAVQNGLLDRSVLTNTPISSLTVKKGWDLYLEQCEQRRITRDLSPRTLKRYRAVRQNFEAFCLRLGIGTCDGITTQLVRRYLVELENGGASYSKQYLEVTLIKQLVKFLVAEELLPEATKIKVPMQKREDTDTYCFSPEEVEAVVEYCRATPGRQWLAPVIIALSRTGLRSGELASLRWSDLHLDDGPDNAMIRLTDERRSHVRRDAGEMRTLKGKRSRHFPIHAELFEELSALPRYPDGLVFHGPKGAKLDPGRVYNRLKYDIIPSIAHRFPTRPGAVIGFKDGYVHSFRHFFCSTCANSNVNPEMLMAWLGHRSSKMLRRYYHALDHASINAMKSVQFKPAGPKPAVAPPGIPQTSADSAKESA